MKDNKLPLMSDEDREKAWKELKEGDTLAYIEWSYWNDKYIIRYLKVVKRTAKGSIRLENQTLLKTFNSEYHVITCKLNNWIQKIRLEEEIMNLMYAADRDKKEFKNNLTYEDAKALKEILERVLQKEV
jgi:hypothetical protein